MKRLSLENEPLISTTPFSAHLGNGATLPIEEDEEPEHDIAAPYYICKCSPYLITIPYPLFLRVTRPRRWKRTNSDTCLVREDSTNLVDAPVASKLGEHRALFYDEEENGMEKFRPMASLPKTG
jgi:hypothetical protein